VSLAAEKKETSSVTIVRFCLSPLFDEGRCVKLVDRMKKLKKFDPDSVNRIRVPVYSAVIPVASDWGYTEVYPERSRHLWRPLRKLEEVVVTRWMPVPSTSLVTGVDDLSVLSPTTGE